mgnify:FL=1
MIHFFLCNILISGIIVILLLLKRLLKNSLSSRMQYNLWFLLLGLLAVPFIPFRFIGLPQIFFWLTGLWNSPSPVPLTNTVQAITSPNSNWMNDFAISVNSKTPPITGYIVAGIWFAGMFIMILSLIKSTLRLRSLKNSALPLQNQEVRILYHRCLEEMNIHRDIPVCSTAFLKSPMIIGFVQPCIYLPIHLISAYNEVDLKYMLLHELQHYRHHDALANVLMNLAGVVYWFHPLVWFSLKEMRNDREIACDTSVLQMLDDDAYADYGNTLINFAEKISMTSFPFSSGLGGNKKQIQRRIIHIASYEKPTFAKKLKGTVAFALMVLLLVGLTPALSAYAADTDHYAWESSSAQISYVDLSSYFGTYDGSFVMYDAGNNAWSIHNIDHALLRVSPDSTYKIYDALFALEAGIITPEHSLMVWDGTSYPFEAWNADQTLPSAMASSVNWYFQSLDRQLGMTALSNDIRNIGYGNENIGGDLSAYWMEGTLAIAPVEQVELLVRLQNNSFGFAPENVQVVKDALHLFSSDDAIYYGKTGTGRVDGQDVNGWFVGFIETPDTTYYFATNIQADSKATGSAASEITMSILSDMAIWK